MANIYGHPAVGEFQKVFDDAEGVVFVETFSSQLTFLIQSWNLIKAERLQEVKTLADTEHLYTFGKELPRIELSGYFINKTLSPKMSASFETQERTTSSEILRIWDEMRAKSIGQLSSDSDIIDPLVSVEIAPLERVFFGVGVNLRLTNTITMEALIDASFTVLVMEEEGLG